MKNIFAVFAVTFLLITTCYAEEPRTVGIYKRHMAIDNQHKKDFDHILHHMLYLSGISDGYITINKRRTADKQKLLYCQPDTVTLHGADYMKLLEKALSRSDNPIAEHLSVAEAMLLALEEEFPCHLTQP